jgi:hypothetical protein
MLTAKNEGRRMRFSLKWILAAMVYVAIAAAALRPSGKGYVMALWAFSISVIVCAFVLAIFGEGQRRIAAFSFAFATVAFFAGHAFSNFRPVDWLYTRLGLSVSYDTAGELRVSAANAVATLAFGLMGSLLGLAVFRAVSGTNGD